MTLANISAVILKSTKSSSDHFLVNFKVLKVSNPFKTPSVTMGTTRMDFTPRDFKNSFSATASAGNSSGDETYITFEFLIFSKKTENLENKTLLISLAPSIPGAHHSKVVFTT